MRRRLLVVDDDDTIRDSLVEALSDSSTEVAAAESAERALSIVGTRGADVVLTDVRMAGLDGVKNKIDPGKAMDANLYELPADELAKVPTVCGSLREAMNALKADHQFLLAGDVFTKDAIEAYIDLKMEEIDAFETMPHPIEYLMYYSS